VEQAGQAGGEDHELQGREQQAHAVRHRAHQALAGRQRPRGERQAHAQHQRPERQHAPVDEHALREGARARHAPDRVHRAVDREHQRQCGQHQHAQAHRAQARGLGGKLRQGAEDGLGDAVGHQALQEVFFERGLKAREHRERAEHRQHHRHQRHQRDQRGEGQAAGREAEVVFAEALAQRARGVHPRPALQRFGQLVGAAAPLLEGTRQLHRPMMPAMQNTPDATLLRLRAIAVASLLALIALGLAWELWLAPTGARTWALKVLPLAFALPGLLRLRMFTHRWLSLLVWLYVAEGAVRAVTERGVVVPLAVAQVLLGVLLFAACAAHVRWRLRKI
jgi:uncharacterized membrane protein